jgi:Ca2+-binding EF-hand superfamily protein
MKAFLVMGMRLDTEELKVIMNEYDVDGSGQIDLDEFEGMIRLG